MSSDSSSPTARPDLESARLGMKVKDGAPDVLGLSEPDGTFPDKDGPNGPPGKKAKPIPAHLKKIVNFFQAIVADEALLLEMCFEQCMVIVRESVSSNAAGADYFSGPNGDGGASFTPGHYATIAGPMACALYKEVLEAIKGRAQEYEELFNDSVREREKAAGKPPSGIIIATGR